MSEQEINQDNQFTSGSNIENNISLHNEIKEDNYEQDISLWQNIIDTQTHSNKVSLIPGIDFEIKIEGTKLPEDFASNDYCMRPCGCLDEKNIRITTSYLDD